MTSTAPHSRTPLLLLALIFSLAAGIRIYNLSTLGFWTDELGAMSASGGWGLDFVRPPLNRIIDKPLPICTRLADARPVSQIIPNLIRDESHPPVFFLLLRLWRSIFGDSESAVRSLNVIFSLAAIPLLYIAAANTVGTIPALWACLLMAVASPQITFAQEARNYMPAMTLSLAALVCLQRLELRPTTGRAIAFSLALLIMMLTHMFTAGPASAMAICAGTALRGRTRTLAIISISGAAILFLLLWGLPLYHQLPNFHSNYTWLSDSSPGQSTRWLLRIATAPFALVADRSWPIAWAGCAIYFWLPIAFVKRPALRLWILWFVCSLGMIASLDLLRSTAQLGLLRYLLFASPAAYVLIAAAVNGYGQWIAPAALVVTAMFAIPSAYVPGWKTDYKTPDQMVARQLDPTDCVVIGGPDAIADAVMFAAYQHYAPLPETAVVLTEPPDEAVLARLRQSPKVGVIWLWQNGTKIKGFDVHDQVPIPHLGTILIGRFRPPQ